MKGLDLLDRRDPTGRYPGTLGADQAIPLEKALPIFTINGARSLGMEAETGSLERGKWADFILLDRPLDGQSPEDPTISGGWAGSGLG